MYCIVDAILCKSMQPIHANTVYLMKFSYKIYKGLFNAFNTMIRKLWTLQSCCGQNGSTGTNFTKPTSWGQYTVITSLCSAATTSTMYDTCTLHQGIWMNNPDEVALMLVMLVSREALSRRAAWSNHPLLLRLTELLPAPLRGSGVTVALLP